MKDRIIIDNLSKEEIELVIQSLIFSSSADIISEWNEEDNLKLLDIAVKIKRNTFLKREDINLNVLKITKENICDNLAKVKLIKQYFDIKEF